jgi:MoaA/NifB/PqqE/SkfB family radical SAM enzyme
MKVDDKTTAIRLARSKRSATGIRATTYELTKKCNLKCEGCCYFEGETFDARKGIAEVTDLEAWRSFFASEINRGITCPNLSGGEPSLVQDRLRLAGQFWKMGVIYTNGQGRIDPDINFKIHLSIWTVDENKDRLYRGASTLKNIFANYADDPRAVVVFTMNHENIRKIPKAVELCRENGLPITFNHYHTTPHVERSRRTGLNEKSDFLRFTCSDRNLCLTDADLAEIKTTLNEAMDMYPGTVIYSKALNEWINRPQPLVTLDPRTGRALNCVVYNDPIHREVRPDFSYDDQECCLPNHVCSSCRTYASAYAQYLRPARTRMREAGIRNWFEVFDTWCRLWIPSRPVP